MKSNKTLLWVIGLVAVILLGSTAFIASNQDSDDNGEDMAQTTSESSEEVKQSSENEESESNSTESVSQDYFDGTYSASSTYSSPAPDLETIFVEVTVQDGIVQELLVTGESETPVSTRYQELFSQGIEAEIVGKSLDTDSPERVNGSSLTSVGFNKALESIRKQAQV